MPKLRHFLKKGQNVEKEKFLVNASDLMSKFISSELKAFFANPFPKRLNSLVIIFYLYYAINRIPWILL